MLIAHRGFRNINQENRLVDFKKALKITKAVELDIRLTKDNKIIIFHDRDFKRIGNFKQKVKQLKYQEIKNLPFFKNNPEWKPILLDNFAKLVGNKYKFINLEIKPDCYTNDQYKIIFEGIRKLKNLSAEIVVSSFEKKDLEKILKLESRFKKGYLFKRISNFDEKFAKNFDYIHPRLKIINRKKNVEYFKKLNILMNPWTYKKNQEAQKSYKIYGKLIYGYISDKPDLIIKKNVM